MKIAMQFFEIFGWCKCPPGCAPGVTYHFWWSYWCFFSKYEKCECVKRPKISSIL